MRKIQENYKKKIGYVKKVIAGIVVNLLSSEIKESTSRIVELVVTVLFPLEVTRLLSWVSANTENTTKSISAYPHPNGNITPNKIFNYLGKGYFGGYLQEESKRKLW